MDSAQKINWDSNESHLFLNPRLSTQEREQLITLHEKFNVFPGHIWLTSSGSSQSKKNSLKLIALPKRAFMVAASSANDHLRITSKDSWLQILPRFHVGGLSIEAREVVGGAKLVQAPSALMQKWSAVEFAKFCEQTRPTWASLVPTQIFDLVQAQIPCPKSFRGIVVGGGSLNEELYLSATKLGYSLFPSYGMTETCAQIATAKSGEQWLQTKSVPILKHVQVRTTEDQRLEVFSGSLLTGFAQIRDGKFTFEDPKNEGWYTTSDRVQIQEGHLKFLGRVGDYIKVMGEGVDLYRLREILQKLSRADFSKVFLISRADPRSENQICLYSELNTEKTKHLVEMFNAEVLPYERITFFKADHQIRRTALGKVKLEQE